MEAREYGRGTSAEQGKKAAIKELRDRIKTLDPKVCSLALNAISMSHIQYCFKFVICKDLIYTKMRMLQYQVQDVKNR